MAGGSNCGLGLNRWLELDCRLRPGRRGASIPSDAATSDQLDFGFAGRGLASGRLRSTGFAGVTAWCFGSAAGNGAPSSWASSDQ